MDFKHKNIMKVSIAITAASGAIYAQKLLQNLVKNPEIEIIHLILSDNAKSVVELEIGTDWLQKLGNKVEHLDNHNFYCSIASGSNCDDVMIIVPCSAGCMGRIAHGVSDSLITRAADVILKERKKLILALRESPYNLIHIENMRLITLAGGIILPASPTFYHLPQTIDDTVLSVVERIEQCAEISAKRKKWKE